MSMAATRFEAIATLEKERVRVRDDGVQFMGTLSSFELIRATPLFSSWLRDCGDNYLDTRRNCRGSLAN
jgi:hypothetical protein